jgi:hypothetical protein
LKDIEMVDFKKTPMTKEQAEWVRHWRVDYGYSWQAVAERVAKLFPSLNIKKYPTGDKCKTEGERLCQEAAEFFGENAGDEPWN